MNLVVGEKYDVVVSQILDFGVVVVMEDDSTQLIHISNIADEYIADICEYVSVGNKYSAICEPNEQRGVQLSLKHLGLKSARKKEYEAARNARRSNSNNSNLDDMIDAANASYQSKKQDRDRRNRKSRR